MPIQSIEAREKIRQTLRAKAAASAMDRFMDRVAHEPNTGCWLWSGTATVDGYGVVEVRGKKLYAHRVSYEWFCGPIPERLTIDHLCRVRCCVNPEHLEPVTNVENVKRAAAANRPSQCRAGHPYDEANSAFYKGRRKCKECNRLNARRYWVEKRRGAS
jgi:hypothetical protein